MKIHPLPRYSATRVTVATKQTFLQVRVKLLLAKNFHMKWIKNTAYESI